MCKKDKQFRATVSFVVIMVGFGGITGWYCELKMSFYKHFYIRSQYS
jgi:hypothetical protein